MKNTVATMMMNQLRMNNPQMYQILNLNKNNPIDLLKQMASNSSNEQMQQLFNKARQIGFPNEVLAEIQNQIGMNSN